MASTFFVDKWPYLRIWIILFFFGYIKLGDPTKDSNNYVVKTRVLEPNLQIWYQKHMSATFDIK